MAFADLVAVAGTHGVTGAGNGRQQWSKIMNDRERGRQASSTARFAIHHAAGALIVVDPSSDRVRSVLVAPDGLSIGRAPSSGLVLTDPGASRTHAVVHAQGGEYVIEDRHSLNGTFLNGGRITTPRVLRDGDRLRFGRLEAEFRLVDPAIPRPDQKPEPGPDWQPDRPTRPIGGPHPGLREELRESSGFSFGALALAVIGSVVGTILVSAVQGGDGTDQNANWRLLGAALGPIISTTFTTRQAGEKGRVRAASIVLLSSAAVVVTFTGFGVGDVVKGSSVLPGVAQGATLPLPGLSRVILQEPTVIDGTSPGATSVPVVGPALQAPDGQDCGRADLGDVIPCGPIAVTSTGTERLNIRSIEIEGAHEVDFAADRTCVGAGLEPGEVCEITLGFGPTEAGEREASLVIEHDGADDVTEIRLTGFGDGGLGTDPETDQG